MGDVNRKREAPDPRGRMHGGSVHLFLTQTHPDSWSEEDRKQFERGLADGTIRITTNFDTAISATEAAVEVDANRHRVIPGRSEPFEQSVVDRWERLLKCLTVFDALGDQFRSIRGGRLHRPPGYSLLWLADFLYSRKSVEECLRPTVQDLQEEYAEALAAQRPYKARWVRIRGTWSFACAASLLTMASVGKQVVKIWRAVG